MDKAPDAYRTISEVAEDLDLPQHVLRFWETRFAQIRPLKRGGGRRYYRPEDIDLLKGIRHLLYGEGYTIRGVQRIIKESGVKAMQGLGRGEGAASLPKPRGPEIIGPAQADSDAFDDDDAADGETHEAADDRLHGGRTGPEEPELTPEGREPVFSGAGYAARPYEAVRREPVMGQPARAMEHEPGPVAPRHAGYADSSEPMPERQPAAPLRQVPEPVRRPLGPSASVVEPRMPSQAAEHAPAPAAVRRLSTDDVRRLQAAIYELTECRKRLDQAIVIR